MQGKTPAKLHFGLLLGVSARTGPTAHRYALRLRKIKTDFNLYEIAWSVGNSGIDKLVIEKPRIKQMRAQYSWFAMFSPSEVLELVMLCRQTAHSATDFSPMDGNAKMKKTGANI